MITKARLLRHAEQGSHVRLLSEVLANGRPVHPGVRRRLMTDDALPAAALGLALQRLAEIEFGPSDSMERVAALLLTEQGEDGAIGTPASTAAAANGLLCAARHYEGAGRTDEERRIGGSFREAAMRAARSIGAAADRAWMRDVHGLLGDPVETGVVIWQLGAEPGLWSAARLPDLVAAARQARLESDPVCRALVGAALSRGALAA